MTLDLPADFSAKISLTKIIKAGVIGYPVNNSLSPKIHNFYLKKLNINGSYQAIEINPDDFDKTINDLVNQGFKGFNVTIPFKEKIFQKCDFLSDEAKIIKAVNTVVIDKNNKLHGFNSDASGFVNNIFCKYPDFILKDKNAFVIGSGGACRAIIFALLKHQVKNIFITNRNSIRANNLINDFLEFAKQQNSKLFFLEHKNFENELANCDILINSSSLGMINQDPLKLDLKNLKNSAIVYDIVYKPLITELLKNAKDRGNPIITGIGMLIKQALVGFNMWHDVLIEDNEDLEQILTLNNL